jgi:hypothetical protein
MINLLPPEEKKEQRERKIFSKLLDLEFLFFGFLISLVLIFLFFHTKLQFFLKEKETELSLKKKEILLYQDIEKELNLFNDLISKVKSILKEDKKTTLVLERIIEILPPEVSIENISFALSKNKEYFEVNLSGFASRRSDLVLLRLKLEENFENVLFSPESWVKPTDINFFVSFKAK